jgi:hypothetical protein
VQVDEAHEPSVPARERDRALVVGTGDPSDMALGGCIYWVRDHKSPATVDVSVSNTLMRSLV